MVDVINGGAEIPGTDLQISRETAQLAGSKRITEDMVKDVEQQVVLRKRLKRAVLAVTSVRDWHDMGGTPYPKDSAIHAMAQVAGAEFSPPEWSEESGDDKDGRWRIFYAEVSCEWGGRRVTEIGAGSTKDPFYSRKNGSRVPYEEIRVDQVRKKALTNGQHRSLVKELGLGAITWEDLHEYAVSKPKESVQYRKAPLQPPVRGGPPRPEDRPEPGSDG